MRVKLADYCSDFPSVFDNNWPSLVAILAHFVKIIAEMIQIIVILIWTSFNLFSAKCTTRVLSNPLSYCNDHCLSTFTFFLKVICISGDNFCHSAAEQWVVFFFRSYCFFWLWAHAYTSEICRVWSSPSSFVHHDRFSLLIVHCSFWRYFAKEFVPNRSPCFT